VKDGVYMKIEVPYEVGDKVYIIKYVSKHWIKCPTCKGSGICGEDEYGSDRSCSTCNMRHGGWFEDVQPYWTVHKEELEVNGILVNASSTLLRLGTNYEFKGRSYWTNYDDGSLLRDGLVNLKYIFRTKEEAEFYASEATKNLREAENTLRNRGR
jgi:hypothetical protein